MRSLTTTDDRRRRSTRRSQAAPCESRLRRVVREVRPAGARSTAGAATELSRPGDSIPMPSEAICQVRVVRRISISFGDLPFDLGRCSEPEQRQRRCYPPVSVELDPLRCESCAQSGGFLEASSRRPAATDRPYAARPRTMPRTHPVGGTSSRHPDAARRPLSPSSR